ncbi:MAG TPA: HAMP domain-containing histidine kinase [Firmicutes bacterium]|nr:HAMP domain-containing histidine kinase [Bacillota bacterium]
MGAFLGALSVSAAAFLFQYWKYRQIGRLADYLTRINAGEYDLDVRDNAEGELSILKNEIYKTTTRLAEYNETLRREKVRLADAMSDISHQLKTPLTSMMVMADLLRDDSLPAGKREEFTARLLAQLERIQWLVSSLLKLSKLDVGTAGMKQETVRLKETVEKAAAPLRIPMELKEQRLVLEGPEEAVFQGDLSWTAEALLNVMKNCMEHTPPGGEVRVEWSDNPLYAQIRISDNGEGIDKADLPHIFTRFYRGKNASGDSVGIGLAMAKSILSQQHGEITVSSERGKGTAFRIRMYKTVI